jgi:hypothetical protein
MVGAGEEGFRASRCLADRVERTAPQRRGFADSAARNLA